MTIPQGQACRLCGFVHPFTESLPGHPTIPKIPDSLEVDFQHAAFKPASIIRCENHTECLDRQKGPDGNLRSDIPPI